MIWLDEKHKLYNCIIMYNSVTISLVYYIYCCSSVIWVYLWVLVLLQILDPWVQVPVYRYSHRSGSGQHNQGDSQVQIQVICGSTCAHPYPTPSPFCSQSILCTHTPCSPATTSITNSSVNKKLLNDIVVQDDAVAPAHKETETKIKYETQLKVRWHALTESVGFTPTDLWVCELELLTVSFLTIPYVRRGITSNA